MHAVEQFGSSDCRNREVFIRIFSKLRFYVTPVAFPSDQHAGIDQQSHGESDTAGSCRVAFSTAFQKPGSGFGSERSKVKKVSAGKPHRPDVRDFKNGFSASLNDERLSAVAYTIEQLGKAARRLSRGNDYGWL